ncbi:MAG TPA: transglutaminase family protein [Opitutaceae bacterium]|nr:transglutaminase family protein [Opitutaceae bacterium]
MPNLRVTHHTTCRHRGLATAAWQMLQLQPRNEPAQECLDFQLEISPAASDLESRTDYFGNTRHFFSLCEPHMEMKITSHSTVRRNADVRPLPGITLPLASARTQVASLVRERGQFELEQYLHATARIPLLPAAAALADGLEADTPLLDWMEALGKNFGESFTFDPTATDVSTPLTEVLQTRRGVCQDFAHLFLSCVRQQGLPAAYVSGYLLTNPPPGQPRLRGADAMHAWVSVFVPEVGWTDYDPTNTCFTGMGHIVVARGRDYADVSPTRGVFGGGGGHSLSVGVTVEPEP